MRKPSNDAKQRRQWHVDDPDSRHWFDDEFTARTYLLPVRAAFGLRTGVNLFHGLSVPPAGTRAPTTSSATPTQ